MRRCTLYSISACHSLLVVLAALGAAGGCWQEVVYTSPDSTVVARRETSLTADGPPASKTEKIPDATSLESPTPVTPEASTAEPMTAGPSPPRESTPAESPTADEETEAAKARADESAAAETQEPDLLDELFAEDPESEANTNTAAATPESESPVSSPEAEATVPATNTRLATWILGSKWTLAALANDRGIVPEDVVKWSAEARAAADALGTSFDELPPPAEGPHEFGSPVVHDYLYQQGQRMWQAISEQQGAAHAALFEVAVKSNVLLVLYQPGSEAAEALAESLRGNASQAELPPELLQPLLERLTEKAPPAAVRAAVRRMHANIEQHLKKPAEQQ